MTDQPITSPPDLDDIRFALDCCSPQPWRRVDGTSFVRAADGSGLLTVDKDCMPSVWSMEDAELIAQAPTWLAAVVAQVDKLSAIARSAERLVTLEIVAAVVASRVVP